MDAYIEIYLNPETDEFSVTVVGSDDWDDICGLTEQEAMDEAIAISDETGYSVIKEVEVLLKI